jgi:TolB-like protein/DNA-binding winged helix-turn-helix (wHTH) protein/Tfp pilus assembly protein PilF
MKSKMYRFAGFELRPAESELSTAESRLRLQEKPLLLLTALLDNPQTLVTRDQLRERMWDSDTYVDYEQGINVAVKKVRDALGDSAEQPRFIQTVAKKGYRLLPPVEVIAAEDGPPDVQSLPAASPVSPAVPTRQPLLFVSWRLAFLAIAITAVFAVRYFHTREENRRPEPVRSLAVLPMRNLSPEPGQEYFADGVTEELITDLAQSLPFRVISRTSVMRYKETNEPVSQIARELGVQLIVEGAVARSGDRVTVTVQLIDAADDRHLWAKKFDRKIGDILTVEGELSQEIAGQVGVALDADRRSQLANSRLVDPDVYELCLLGRYFWNKRTPAGLAKSIEYFQQAIQHDPNYAPAYAGLADSYEILPMYDSVDVDENFAKARVAAKRAIELDETLADAHLAMAFVALNYWRTESKEAQREFNRSLELNPNDANAHHWFGYYLVFSGNLAGAVAEMERARQLDPLSAIINADEGHLLYAAGRNGEAATRLRQAIELAPDLGQPHETMALIEVAEGRGSEALDEARRGLELDSNNPRTMGEAGYVLAQTGHTEEAGKLLAQLNDLVRRGSGFPSYPALILIGLGERSEAIDFLENAERTSKDGGGLQGLSQWPIFDQLKSDSRYQKLLSESHQ